MLDEGINGGGAVLQRVTFNKSSGGGGWGGKEIGKSNFFKLLVDPKNPNLLHFAVANLGIHAIEINFNALFTNTGKPFSAYSVVTVVSSR